MLRLVFANPDLVAVPASVVVPAGQLSATFYVAPAGAAQGWIGIEGFAFATVLAEFQVSPATGSQGGSGHPRPIEP
jgi:hypothetical protein